MAEKIHFTNHQEAEYFARAFLMPEKLFLKVAIEHYKNGEYHITEIAKSFGLDVFSVIARGNDLGIWE